MAGLAGLELPKEPLICAQCLQATRNITIASLKQERFECRMRNAASSGPLKRLPFTP